MTTGMEQELNRLMQDGAASRPGAVTRVRGSLSSVLRAGAFFAGRMPDAEKRQAFHQRFLDLLAPLAAQMTRAAKAMCAAQAAGCLI